MPGARVVLHVAPHPDDELLGAPAHLMALRDAGWRVVDVAVSLGRPADRARRRAEAEEACRRAGFELVVLDPPVALARNVDGGDAAAQADLEERLRALIGRLAPGVIAAPHPHDGHPAHELVGRAVCAAVRRTAFAGRVLFWGLWSDLPLPTSVCRFGEPRLREIQHALRAHAGELARTPYDELAESRARTHAVLGDERVFGFGAAAASGPFAELTMQAVHDPRDGWRLVAPRVFDAADALGGAPGAPIGWLLEEPSPRARLAGAVAHGGAPPR